MEINAIGSAFAPGKKSRIHISEEKFFGFVP